MNGMDSSAPFDEPAGVSGSALCILPISDYWLPPFTEGSAESGGCNDRSEAYSVVLAVLDNPEDRRYEKWRAAWYSD